MAFAIGPSGSRLLPPELTILRVGNSKNISYARAFYNCSGDIPLKVCCIGCGGACC